MLKKIVMVLLAFASLVAFAEKKVELNNQQVRSTTETFKKSTVYQILLQQFTQEGTLKQAEKMLPHIKSLGIDIIYLCPISEPDDDMDKSFWSVRQRSSGTENPRNPYRMKDYYKVDPRFGTDADLKSYVDTAHSLGMKVLFDLVYYHCGPKAVFIDTNPDFVIRDENGKVKKGEWGFANLNFKNKELREYLIKNMEYFIEKFGVDGYRTDVEGYLPSDFWDEAYSRVVKLKPDVIMIAESARVSAQLKVYDANYSLRWEYALFDAFYGTKPLKKLREVWEREFLMYPRNARILRALETHDTASDYFQRYGARTESLVSVRGMDAIQVVNFTIDGIPFLYNGNEFADNSEFSMFADKRHGRFFVAWENLLTKEGQNRMELIKKLVAMKKNEEALWNGSTTWLDNSASDKVISFTRNTKAENILVVVNSSKEQLEASVKIKLGKSTPLLCYGCELKVEGDSVTVKMKPYGYIVTQY